MSFSDVIKKSVLEGFAQSDIGTVTIVVTLGVTGLIALYIYAIYRLASRSAFYNRDFNKTLALMPIVTAGIVLAMQSSIVISLGMVGALSIVRFRNAVKDSMDLLYLFWSIGVGIICGARLFEIAVVVSLAVTALIFLLDLVPSAKPPYLLVVNSTDTEIDPAPHELSTGHAEGAREKSPSDSGDRVGRSLELRTDDGSRLVSACAALPGVESVNLLAHDGEVRY